MNTKLVIGNKREKCVYCKKSIHITNWAGVGKKGFICNNMDCLKKAMEDLK